MTTTRYVVLRALGAEVEGVATAGPRAAGTPTTRTARRLAVDVLDGPMGSAARADPDGDVVAIARSMPIRMIEPKRRVKVAKSTVQAVAWGVQAIAADTSPYDGRGVTVAVLDTGIADKHPAFKGVQLIRKNFTGESDDDQDGHGTHCAGIIFGRAVNGCRIGVAPGVKRALIAKVLGKKGGSTAAIAEAIEWAVKKGAHVVSMSLGIDYPGMVRELIKKGYPTELATSEALTAYRDTVRLFDTLGPYMRQAAMMAGHGGALLVAAAGNESRREVRPDWVISCSPPANAEGFVSVAALGKGEPTFTVAEFSNVDARVAAPGVDIVSAALGGGLVSMSGTSMAGPHVAGVAALWAQQLLATGPVLPEDVANRTLAHVNRVAGQSRRDLGMGIVQAPQ